MSSPNAKQFLELLEKSKLAKTADVVAAVGDEDQFARLVEQDDAKAIADRLVNAGLITQWHATNLLAGKYKGFHLGKYRLKDLLGTGGMSTVYLAEHMLMQRPVAVKVLPRRRVKDSSYLDRFIREAKAVAQLDHANIVRAYDIDHEGDTHYIVMEYVEGTDLQIEVKENGPLPFDVAADYIAQAAVGLQHAHQRGLVHRDMKPANLLVDRKGTVKILDLGLARFSDDDEASLTIAHSENVLGTADYLAPEQARNSHKADHRADIYGLGCTLYYLLTGHPPFSEGTLAERILKHQTEKPADVRVSRPDCPTPLVNILLKMIAKNPAKRFQNAEEIATTLQSWLKTRADALPEIRVRPRQKVAAGARGGGSGGSSKLSLPTAKRLSDHPGRAPGRAAEDTVSNQSRRTVKGPLPVAKPLREANEGLSSNSNVLSGIDELMEDVGFAEGRKLRQTTPVVRKPPIWLWVGLGTLVVICVALLFYVVAMSN